MLGTQVEGYRAWLVQLGYTPQTVRNMLADLGQVGLWLSAAGLEAAQVDEEQWRRSSPPDTGPAVEGSPGRGRWCRS